MTVRRCARFLLIVALLAAPAALAAQRRGPGPLRIVLLVDSSNAVAPMLPQFRAALNAFLDVLPGDPEIAFISTGGQLRVRVPPTTDRLVLHQAADRFASDGGANSFLDTMLEADQRFLKVAPDRRSVFVIITTDSGDLRGEVRIDQYNRFMKEFTDRGGRAHGIVVRGVQRRIHHRHPDEPDPQHERVLRFAHHRQRARGPDEGARRDRRARHASLAHVSRVS